ncbi:hypothetical protein RFI_14386, partial [Reticulomyxa filosa]
NNNNNNNNGVLITTATTSLSASVIEQLPIRKVEPDGRERRRPHAPLRDEGDYDRGEEEEIIMIEDGMHREMEPEEKRKENQEEEEEDGNDDGNDNEEEEEEEEEEKEEEEEEEGRQRKKRRKGVGKEKERDDQEEEGTERETTDKNKKWRFWCCFSKNESLVVNFVKTKKSKSEKHVNNDNPFKASFGGSKTPLPPTKPSLRGRLSKVSEEENEIILEEASVDAPMTTLTATGAFAITTTTTTTMDTAIAPATAETMTMMMDHDGGNAKGLEGVDMQDEMEHKRADDPTHSIALISDDYNAISQKIRNKNQSRYLAKAQKRKKKHKNTEIKKTQSHSTLFTATPEQAKSPHFNELELNETLSCPYPTLILPAKVVARKNQASKETADRVYGK